MEKTPKVSVIIPTYNRKEYVTEAINSVLNQTFRDFEIIVVDDGSTDGTGEELKERYGDRIRYFYKENGGCASARNYGLRLANGEYISFLDSDDRYLPEKLEDQVKILDENEQYSFVSSDIIYFNGVKKYVIKVVRPDKKGDITCPLFITTYFCLPASTFRRECFDKVGYFDESMRYNEDTDMLLRIAVKFKSAFSRIPTYLINLHRDRKSNDKINLLNAVYVSSEKVLKTYPDLRLKLGKFADKRLAQIKLELSMEHVLKKEFAKALQELNLSQILYPTYKRRIYKYLLSKRLLQDSIIPQVIIFIEMIIRAFKSYLYQYTGLILN